jgi:acetyl-CoA carboxylase carboxyl transferase subunit alpha
LNLVDEVLPEPLGGAHSDPATAGAIVKKHLLANLESLLAVPPAERLKQRYARFRSHGRFMEKPPTPEDAVPIAAS